MTSYNDVRGLIFSWFDFSKEISKIISDFENWKSWLSRKGKAWWTLVKCWWTQHHHKHIHLFYIYIYYWRFIIIGEGLGSHKPVSPSTFVCIFQDGTLIFNPIYLDQWFEEIRGEALTGLNHHICVPLPKWDMDLQPHISWSFLWSMIWCESWLFRFVDIAGIVDHHCLNFFP